jgi:hypothetical protein
VGKKSRSKTRKKWSKTHADEIITYGPLRLERYGRFVRLSNNSTPEQHSSVLKRSEEINKKIIEELEHEIPALQKHVGSYDPIEVMHRAAYMLLPLFLKYRSENEYSPTESDYLPAVEYIQYLIARTPANTSGKTPSAPEWDVLWEQVLKVMKLTRSYVMSRKTLVTPPSEIDELRFHLDIKRLSLRVRRYSFFMADHLKSSLTPYEQWIKDRYGVTVDQIIIGVRRIAEYEQTGVLKRYQDAKEADLALTNKLIASGFVLGHEATAEQVEQAKKALMSDEFQSLYLEVQEKMRLTFTPAIFDITEISPLPQTLMSLFSVRPGESILTKLTGPNHDDLSPLSTSVLHYKPFLYANARFYTFYHSGFQDRISEIIEADLFAHYKNKIPVMAKRRSDQIEADAANLLKSVTNADFFHLNVFYPDAANSNNLTELDILLGVDDILFVAEVKAGGFSDAATRGSPKSIEKELADSIIEGQRQSERAEKYLTTADEVPFFDQTGKNVYCTIKRRQYRKIFRVIVTREDLGWVGARIAVLSVIEPNLSKSYPWHVSLDDLRIVRELFKDNEIRFVHFLEQRLLASSQRALAQHDEIEHIGLYNAMNRYDELPVQGVDHITYDPSYMRNIDFYFVEKIIGQTPPLPTQPFPPRMKAFLDALKNCKLPGRFEFGSMILSLDERSRGLLEKGLDYIASAKAEGRERTFRLPVTAASYGFSVTNKTANRLTEELFDSAVQMQRARCNRWLVAHSLDAETDQIDKLELLVPGRYSEGELAPANTRLEERVARIIATNKIGRNDTCPCGSGIKFKRCHGK